MHITIIGIDSNMLGQAAQVGGVIVDHDGVFKTHKLVVRENYIKLRNYNNGAVGSLVLARDEFVRIEIN